MAAAKKVEEARRQVAAAKKAEAERHQVAAEKAEETRRQLAADQAVNQKTANFRRLVEEAESRQVVGSKGGIILMVNRAQVYVRSAATVQSDRVAVLKQGMEVEQIDSWNDWRKIRLPDGSEGWLHSDLVLLCRL